MTCVAASSIWSVVADRAISRLSSVWEVCCVFVEVDGFPSWYMSMRFRGMGSKNDGWLRLVGYFCL